VDAADEDRILGKTSAEHWADRIREAREALEGVNPAAVLEDQSLLEEAARRMFEIARAKSPYAEDIAWETGQPSKDLYYRSVRAAAEELLDEEQSA
jgi:hypothetical protein